MDTPNKSVVSGVFLLTEQVFKPLLDRLRQKHPALFLFTYVDLALLATAKDRHSKSMGYQSI